jgi:C4-dicarboxylate-specific signal transduction histidine kinase
MADYTTGFEVRLSVLYLLPVAMATWFVGLGAGAFVSAAAAVAWGLMFQASHTYSGQGYFYWEVALNIGMFFLFAVLLVRLRDALRHSDMRFVTAMQSLEAAVYATDARGKRILFANHRFMENFADAAQRLDAAALGERLGTGLGQPGESLAAEVLDRDTQRWYLHGTRSVRWVDGTRAQLHVLTDVTEARQARDLRRKHEETLHRTSRIVALAEMASSLGHELNQPLGAIGAYLAACERLLGEPRPDLAALREVIGKCSTQASRSGTILRRVRDFVARREPVRRETDLNGTVAEVVRMLQAETLANGIAVELAADAAAAPAPFDRVLLEQALVNLLRNAIEALAGVAPERRRIVVRTQSGARGEAKLSVEDNGPGLAADIEGRLFTSFVTTKPGGTGLGLSICRSIVEAHGGRLSHERLASGGCAFRLTLPGGAP